MAVLIEELIKFLKNIHFSPVFRIGKWEAAEGEEDQRHVRSAISYCRLYE